MDEKEQFDIRNEPGFTGELSHPVEPEHILEPDNESIFERQDRLQKIEHSVYDEPALADVDKDASIELSYMHWLAESWQKTSYLQSWMVTFGIVLVAGPLAVISVLFSSMFTHGSTWQMVNLVTFGPMLEEILKIALIYYIVEKKPYLFHGIFQILIAAMAGGLMFAVIENMIYLNVYIPDPSMEIITWRWSVCVLLHVSCSAIASFGLIRMWLDTFQRQNRPRLELAYPFLAAAMIVHGCYNGLALLMDFAGAF